MKPKESQFSEEENQAAAPEWFNRPTTYEDMLEEEARRKDEKDFPTLETSVPKVDTPF